MAETYEEYEETHHVTRKSVTTFKIEETSSSTTTKTITTPAKLYGKDVGAYDDIDVDELLAQLSPEEITMLAKEVDPDDSFLPPSQRTNYECDKAPTGPLDRKKLIDHINKQALETPDRPELEPFVPGVVRGKKWIPPPQAAKLQAADEQIAIDLGDEYEQALSDATQEEIIDLAAILGFHSMMNQDQYHASLLNKGQPVGLGWDGITKSAIPKIFPAEAPNTTDPEETIQRIKSDDSKLVEVNLNNIKTISDEQFDKLFEALKSNTHLEVLSLTNVGLTDRTALMLAAALEQNHALRVLNVETNFISPTVIVTLVKSLLTQMTIEEFRASNQRSQVFGNKIEMEITELVEKNTTLLRLGLHLEFNDARHRVAAHLQRNIDRIRVDKRDGRSSRGSYYRPVRIEEELAEMSDVEEEPEEEEEPEVEVPPADYDVEEDPDNVVIRPPPSDDEDITPGTSDREQVSSPKPPRRPHATQPTKHPETTRGNLRDENYLREFTYQRYLRAFTSILGDTVWLRGH